MQPRRLGGPGPVRTIGARFATRSGSSAAPAERTLHGRRRRSGSQNPRAIRRHRRQRPRSASPHRWLPPNHRLAGPRLQLPWSAAKADRSRRGRPVRATRVGARLHHHRARAASTPHRRTGDLRGRRPDDSRRPALGVPRLRAWAQAFLHLARGLDRPPSRTPRSWRRSFAHRFPVLGRDTLFRRQRTSSTTSSSAHRPRSPRAQGRGGIEAEAPSLRVHIAQTDDKFGTTAAQHRRTASRGGAGIQIKRRMDRRTHHGHAVAGRSSAFAGRAGRGSRALAFKPSPSRSRSACLKGLRPVRSRTRSSRYATVCRWA